MSLVVSIQKRFKDFSLDVEFEAKKEVMAILGVSGSGKSLTLKCIAGIVQPDAGYIELDGRVFYDSHRGINLSPQQRNVGYLFQNYALFPNMTVKENIACGIKEKNKDLMISKYIKRFQLEGLEKRYPSQLSGGQQQRVALARIFASQPELLMLDEPFSALDHYLKWQLEQELMDFLQEYKGTVLYVSHNRNEVYRLCDRVVVIGKGKSEFPCSIKQLFESPKTLDAMILSGCKNISRAQKISDDKIRALDWDMILTTNREVSDGITYVGIHPHHILIEEKGKENTFLLNVHRKLEDALENILICEAGNTRLRIETDKHRRLEENKQINIQFPKEKLILID
ncbi:sulfate/molybdate ABC transporter ATP-binding protein [Garciella nitratireducens]|uniref:Molybdate transport system ATP-binding protein n=1 Tax=Garciella nitratireducens DSM 15102 TaxID=1121911 RepID=A0A1T4LVU9_9FIRM|nr:ATP-binding cassette domain-containing protein [Garciella nitratireducens]SJZ58869.1 molybdate transport system ATP-binding protein [Garciella nitratireducens DSM 15102]